MKAQRTIRVEDMKKTVKEHRTSHMRFCYAMAVDRIVRMKEAELVLRLHDLGHRGCAAILGEARHGAPAPASWPLGCHWDHQCVRKAC